jgi:argininosuccinate synthase
MRQKGAIPYCYTANLGQPDEPITTKFPAALLECGAEKARSSIAERNSCAKALPRCNAERSISRLPALLLQHHADWPRRNRNDAGRRDEEDGVDIWGDGSTYKGNDIERFYRYG